MSWIDDIQFTPNDIAYCNKMVGRRKKTHAAATTVFASIPSEDYYQSVHNVGPVTLENIEIAKSMIRAIVDMSGHVVDKALVWKDDLNIKYYRIETHHPEKKEKFTLFLFISYAEGSTVESMLHKPEAWEKFLERF